MKKFSGLLLLEDGTAWDAIGFGNEGFGIGELCFNTSMTGYQEIISDPSYAEQIITFTFPSPATRSVASFMFLLISSAAGHNIEVNV